MLADRNPIVGMANLPNLAKIANLHMKYQKKSLKYKQCKVKDYSNKTKN